MVSAAAGAGSSDPAAGEWGHTFAVITVEMQQDFVPCKKGSLTLD